MSEPESVEHWQQLVEQHKRTAVLVSEDKRAASQALFHVGISVECALKALIMHTERMNCWPSREARPELYTHDLRKLSKVAGIIVPRRDPVAPAWSLLMQWDRHQGYDPRPMPRRTARSWVSAAYGDEGVVTWIYQKLQNR